MLSENTEKLTQFLMKLLIVLKTYGNSIWFILFTLFAHEFIKRLFKILMGTH